MMYEAAGKSSLYLKPLVRFFKNATVGTIKPGDIIDAARTIYAGHALATMNRQGIVPARAVINFAAERGKCHHIKVKLFKEEKPVRRAVDKDWLFKFSAAAMPQIGALALFMASTGARLGQSVSLTWDKVNLNAGEAIIPPAKGFPERIAHLTPIVVAALANVPKRGKRVFGLSSRFRAYAAWKEACKLAGIEYVPPHQAGRHTFATEMIVRNRVDAATTAKLGGWASVALLLKSYAHPEGGKATIDAVFGTPGSQSITGKSRNSAETIVKSKA